MPELPEVEHARRLVARVAEGRRIARVRCARDPRVIPAGAAKVQRALAGARVEHARRHGKWLWLELDRAPHPLFHFGMTGGFHTRDAEALPLKTAPRRRGAGWPPPHAKLELVLDDGRELAFVNVRRFGRVLLRDRPEEEPPISELGFDPLEAMPSPARFAALLGDRRGTLKGLLLDQSFAAGVGNWIADEVLYQARLDPRRAVGVALAGRGAPAARGHPSRRAHGGGPRRRRRSLPEELALPPPLGEGHAHGARRASASRDHRRPYHGVGAVAAALTGVGSFVR